VRREVLRAGFADYFQERVASLDPALLYPFGTPKKSPSTSRRSILDRFESATTNASLFGYDVIVAKSQPSENPNSEVSKHEKLLRLQIKNEVNKHELDLAKTEKENQQLLRQLKAKMHHCQ
jgi:hypothetical protein